MPFENQLIVYVLLALLTALVISFLMTPVVKTFAYKVGAIDVPKDERRMHKVPIPRLGGLAIFIGFMVSILLFVDIRGNQQMQSILLGAVVIVVLGVVDDIMALPALLKFVVQIVAALIPATHGVRILAFSNPNIFSDNLYWVLGSLSIPVTVLWIVAITNSVNLIDGLDGLANGVSAISATTMLVIAMMASEAQVAVVMAALVGASVGFMPYNLNPAKMFMGDTGATFLGYHVHPGAVQVLCGHLLRGAVFDSGPADFRYGLRLHPADCPWTKPHACRPQPYPSPAHRHGPQSKAGGGHAVCDFRHFGIVRRGADHRRRAEGHAAVRGALHRGGGGGPGGLSQGGQGGTAGGTP